MDSSRRAVESYWRSRMIDGATSDEDKVTPVYKLEEVCDLLRSSHVSIVKEVSEFILKRLEHKSPVVKQKALRLIKYSVGKSGADFRREMQRHSVAVRQLLHYKGQPDPLKGDALNKGVRDTAQDAISAIFSEENSKPAPAQISKRMEGFGNSNYEMRSSSSSSDDRKSFLSEVVDIGSATIKQGLSNLAQGNHQRNNDPGSYRGPNLHRSLTVDPDPDNSSGRYEPVQLRNENHGSFGASRNAGGGGSWGQDSRSANAMIENGNSTSSGYTESKTREERLLETVVTSGGVRLQPTRDAIHVFLVEAAKLDALALSRALESKLRSPSWQVRMKAVCVLESILRKRNDEKFSIIASYFDENIDVVEKCSQSPQSSLSEKARKVLSLLGGGKGGRMPTISETSIPAVSPAQVPDLIDTGESDDFFKADDPSEISNDKVKSNVSASATTPFTHDLLGDSFGLASGNSTEQKNEDDDPFADVSFHTEESKQEAGGDLFSGMNFDRKPTSHANQIPATNGPEIFDIFGSSNGTVTKIQEHGKADVNDLLAGMSISEGVKQQGSSSPSIPSEGTNSGTMLGEPHLTMMNASTMFPSAAMPYAMPPGMMLNPALSAHSIPINYGAMGGFLTQQQLLATMSNFQQLSNNLNAAQNAGGGAIQGDGGTALPDIFHPSFPNQIPTSTMSSSKKEDTKAFDFISDHLAAARDPRRVS